VCIGEVAFDNREMRWVSEAEGRSEEQKEGRSSKRYRARRAGDENCMSMAC